MILSIVMPRLSDSMTEGSIDRWHKTKGDTVAVGEPLVDIETDKAIVTYEADEAGVLDEIVVEDGGTAGVGQVIARLTTGDCDDRVRQ